MKQLQRFVGVVVKINITATAEENPPPVQGGNAQPCKQDDENQFITTTTGHEDTRVSERSSRI